MVRHSRPARYPAGWFDRFVDDRDPVARVRLASDTAAALMNRVRAGADPDTVERVLAYANEDGIDTVAELWADAPTHSLAGSLWRIHLIRALVTQRADEMAHLYQLGTSRLRTADPVVAGVAHPTGPEEMRELSDTILRGVFAGDFALALERAAAFSRVIVAGSTDAADEHDIIAPDQASALTRQAARLQAIAGDLAAAAALWRRDALH